MSDDLNKLIKKRLNNIENRIVRLTYLQSHLRRFKEEMTEIDNIKSRTLQGALLFYHYSFSQFILELNKLFGSHKSEYYGFCKLLNHIESNIKYVVWYKCEYTDVEPVNKEYQVCKSGKAKVFWSEVKKNE